MKIVFKVKMRWGFAYLESWYLEIEGQGFNANFSYKVATRDPVSLNKSKNIKTFNLQIKNTAWSLHW